MTIVAADLEAAEYKRHPQMPLGRHADNFYQKRVRDGAITLYFLNAYVYKPRAADHDGGVELEVRLYSPDVERGFDLSLPWAGEVGIEKAEAFIAKAYDALGCIPDHHNND